MIAEYMSDEEALQNFYAAYLEWAEAGAKSRKFDATVGLCTNAAVYADTGVMRLMQQQFLAAGLHPEFPFNNHEDEYFEEYGKHHLNQRRMDWVRAHAHTSSYKLLHLRVLSS